MAKQSERSKARQAKRAGVHPQADFSKSFPPTKPQKAAPFEPKTENQRKYASAMRSSPLVFGLGKAGTGKTYVAGCLAAEALLANKVSRIILTRPAIEAGGEELGFLPGEKEEKFDPYFDPFREVLEERLGASFVKYLIDEGRIKCEPFAYMRGKTFKDAFVILDEAQNASPEKMKLFLTRIGDKANVVINGDETQLDIKGPSGLIDAASRLFHIAKVIRFTSADIVRSGLVQEIVEAYEKPAPDRLHPSLAD